MEVISLKCPNCGSSIKTKEGESIIKCEYCNEEVYIDNGNPNLKNYLILADRYYTDEDYEQAHIYYSKALECNTNDYLIILRKALCKIAISNYDEINATALNDAIINSLKYTQKDIDKYRIIVNETFNIISKVENRIIDFYNENAMNKVDAKYNNAVSFNTLNILENIFLINEKIPNNDDITKKLINNILIFIEYVVSPKLYYTNYVKKSGNKRKDSLKRNKKEMIDIYRFWNQVIDKSNEINSKKIKNKKVPLIQIDIYTIRNTFYVLLLLICLFWLFTAFFR